MKKTRLLLSTAIAFVMACGVGLLAVGCNEPKTYTLTYEKGTEEEGTAPEVKSYEAGASITLAAADTFSKEGYTFTKWLDDATEYDAGATFTMPARNVTLKAKWEQDEPEANTDLTQFVLGKNIYKLGATEVDEMGYFYHEATFTGDPNTNYTFTLSYPDEAVNHDIVVFLDEIDGDEPFSIEEDTIVLKTSQEGTVKFVLAGGMYDAEHYNEAEETVILTVAKGGILKYEVTFYENEFLASMGNSYGEIKVAENSTAAEADIPAYTPQEGYVFVGWFIAESSGGFMAQWTLTDTQFTKDTVVTADIAVIAKVEEAEYNDLDATELKLGKNNLTLGAGDSKEIDYGWITGMVLTRTITFSGTAGENYMFTFARPDIGEFAYYPVVLYYNGLELFDTYEEGFNTIVFKMPKNGSVSFVLDGGEYDSGDYDEETYSATLTIHGGGTIQYNTVFCNSLDNLNMGGRPIPVGEVTVGDGGKIAEDDFPSAPECPSPTMEFDGWYIATPFLNDLDEIEYTYGAEVTKNTVFNFMLPNVYIVPKWKYITPTVTYNNGLSGINEKTITVSSSDLGAPNDNGEYTITLEGATTFTRTGHTLTGWTIGSDSYALGAPFTVNAGETVTITAVWAMDEATITYTVYFYANFEDLGDDTKVIKQCTVASRDKLTSDQYPTLTAEQLPEGKIVDSWWRATYNEENSEWESNPYNDRVDSTTPITVDTYVFPKFKDAPVMPNYSQLNTGANEIVFTSEDSTTPTTQYPYRYYNLVGTVGDTYVITVATSAEHVLYVLKSGTYTGSSNIWIALDKSATDSFEITIPSAGWSTLTFLTDGVGGTHTVTVALKGDDSEPEQTTSLETLSANGFNDSIASIPAAINKGETLTVTGDLVLSSTPDTVDGIFVAVSDGQNYAMPAIKNWVYTEGNSFSASNLSYGFAEELSGGVMDNLENLFVKKT